MDKDEALRIALEALGTVREWEVADYDPLENAITALRQALEQPAQEVSYTDIQMAELIMSDCGHSSDYKPLLDRIAGRLAKYRQALEQPSDIDAAVLAERERIVDLLMIQHEAAKGAHNYWQVAANLIQADVASDT